jgi:hypothetical protein
VFLEALTDTVGPPAPLGGTRLLGARRSRRRRGCSWLATCLAAEGPLRAGSESVSRMANHMMAVTTEPDATRKANRCLLEFPLTRHSVFRDRYVHSVVRERTHVHRCKPVFSLPAYIDRGAKEIPSHLPGTMSVSNSRVEFRAFPQVNNLSMAMPSTYNPVWAFTQAQYS